MKKIMIVSLVGFIAGCQMLLGDVKEQVGEKVAEKMIEGAAGGKVDLDVKSGSVTVKSEDGKIVKLSDNQVKVEGEGVNAVYNVNGGASRPSGSPDRLPSLDGAVNFSFIDSPNVKQLTYEVAGEDWKGNCDKVKAQVLSSGWKDRAGMSFNSDVGVVANFENNDETLNVACTKAENENKVFVVLTATLKSAR